MSDIQEQLNKILSNPEALRQVQSLGEQLGISQNLSPPKVQTQQNVFPQINDDMLKTISRIAPVMQSVKGDDDTTRLLNALRPFLSEEKCIKLDKAEKMLKMLKLIPLLKNNGLF